MARPPFESGDYIRAILIPQVRQFDELFSEKVFPPFADPEAQAEQLAQDYWNARMSEPVGEDDDVDSASVANVAHDRSVSLYSTLFAMQTTLLNLFSAGLYHLFEQQASSLYRDWTGDNGSVSLLRSWLGNHTGIDAARAPTWSETHLLGLIANVVKHAEGRSADELRNLDDRYFRQPLLRQPGFEDISTAAGPVETPLTGEDVYVTKADYDNFVQAVIAFWEWLALECESRQRP
jgi:hypothetical protein